MANRNIFELTLPAAKHVELIAAKTLESVGFYCGLTEEKISECSLALIEACINSVEHSQSEDQLLKIKFIADATKLTIEIHDNGIGFDPDAVAVPEIDTKLKSDYKRGWGLQLMRKMMDEITFTSGKNGTVISMVKYK